MILNTTYREVRHDKSEHVRTQKVDERDYYQLFYCGEVHYINYKTGKELTKTEKMKLETYVLDYQEATKQRTWRKISVILRNVGAFYEGQENSTTIANVSGIEYELKVCYTEFNHMYELASEKSALSILN